MLEGKASLVDACRTRRMKVTEKPSNLLETRIRAEGTLDGMDVRVDLNYITGMPGDSQGTITLRGNAGHILSVLARIWPGAPEERDIVSPGRQNWPDRPKERTKEKEQG